MTKPSSINQYRQNYSVADRWKLIAGNAENISQVVVIPAYAEKNILLSTLVSLARNTPSSLDYSLVICVINNKKDSPDEVKKNNQQTLEYLHTLVNKMSWGHLNFDEDLKYALRFIADSGLRLGYVDASSDGYEIPDNEGGVGMARKIGMDMALELLTRDSDWQKPIVCLDADTLVQSNYLATIRNNFNQKVKTAVVAYEHQEPENDEEKAAIYCYEIFLRYWKLGLKYAKSPYAFHSIGSTMVCSADAYLAVRGMNRREAGEDFYFLNKLAKIGQINYIKKTCVYPSARASWRVPFGTGKRIQRFLSHECEEYILPDPRIFVILLQWLMLVEQTFDKGAKDVLKNAGLINPLLASFLNDCNFERSWTKICRNVKNKTALINQFHGWFDGFKTLKLINRLSRELYLPINMFAAIDRILEMQRIPVPEFIRAVNHPDLAEQKKIIQFLRVIT